MVFYILLVACIILLIWCFLAERSDDAYWIKRNIPFVPRKTMMGILQSYFVSKACQAKVYKNVYDNHQNQPHVGMFLGSQPALLIRDPENIKAILKSDFESFHSRGLLHNPGDKLANNLLFIEDYKIWKLIRIKSTSMFSDYRLRYVFLFVDRCAQDFVKFVGQNETFRHLNFSFLYKYANATISACVFGFESDRTTLDSSFEDISKKVSIPSFLLNIKLFIGYVFPSVFMFLRIKLYGAFEKMFISIYKREVKKRLEREIRNFDFVDVCSDVQQKGYMQDIVTNFELYPTSELMAAQAFFFFLCGIDTSAHALHFALLELSNNPEVLEKLHKEIDRVYDKCDDNLSYDDVHHMWYLEMVVNETLRKYPPIGVIQRKCTKRTVLPVGDFVVEKDVVVVIPVLAIHRDEKYYPNPERFDPERFQSIIMERDHNYTFLAFGEGYRFCIGARLARLQIKAALVRLLRKYTMVPHISTPQHFEKSLFSMRSTQTTFTLKPRELPQKKIALEKYMIMNSQLIGTYRFGYNK